MGLEKNWDGGTQKGWIAKKDQVGKQDGEGDGPKAGDKPGDHILEAEVSLEELAKMLGEELELPRIEPKGRELFSSKVRTYKGIKTVGPESLRHYKRTFKQALRRQISAGLYDPSKPRIIPVRDDFRYRTFKEDVKPEYNAAIIYIMDVSGSMSDDLKEIVRIESFWIDTWLRSQYKGIVSRYIVHDAIAKEVDRETFFRTKESGGTMISSAYKLCSSMIESDYNFLDWNIYPFHFSDGDNWSEDDNKLCEEILREKILPNVNVFCYGQVKSNHSPGSFLRYMDGTFKNDDRVITSQINSKEKIVDSIKDFLGKGK